MLARKNPWDMDFDEWVKEYNPVAEIGVKLDGKLYKYPFGAGKQHYDLWEEIAEEEGVTIDDLAVMLETGDLVDGFIDWSGNFYDREQAADLKNKIKGMKESYELDQLEYLSELENIYIKMLYDSIERGEIDPVEVEQKKSKL